ncbi:MULTISPECIES: HAD-IIB family hydrolase [Pantoea]|jgi:kanosamine-6-phosphate phosphatase|uniref:HAD-IIB family hydrolase n=1 Tax=Pantoea TaxID=53335 RepID=UPI0019147527|nr:MULTISPECIES: HAD-IIB family hydrolase [Pantoea]MBK5013405.1 HAD-IIB family hydrolase [Pantoea sp. S62]
MHSSDKILPPEFSLPAVINTVVCCDLDETYIPYSDDNKIHGGVSELEAFMCLSGEEKGLLLGWVTGTNLRSALRKALGYISRSPHFVCCSLGTEFYWVKDGELSPSTSWAERIERSGYRAENVSRIVDILLGEGIPLEKQPDDYQGPYKMSFYYPVSDQMKRDFESISDLAEQYSIRAIFTKCNPAAGDPANCYDVEFIPLCCGKDQAVLFLMEETSLPKESVIAFGDSANDFAMFAQAGKGYLVANADRFAVEQHGSSLEKAYCHGILSVLQGELS